MIIKLLLLSIFQLMLMWIIVRAFIKHNLIKHSFEYKYITFYLFMSLIPFIGFAPIIVLGIMVVGEIASTFDKSTINKIFMIREK